MTTGTIFIVFVIPGVICILLALAIRFYLQRNPQVKTFQDFVATIAGISQRPSEEVANGSIAESDKIGLDAPMKDRLQVTEATQTVTLDDKEQTVRASITWREFWQISEGQGDFVPKPRGLDLKTLVLDSVVIIKMRGREGGAPVWLRTKKVVDIKLMTFFVGAKNGPPGPAHKFRMNGQEEPVPFNFPGSLGCPSGTWSVVDIGRLKAVKVTGRTDYVNQGDFFPFVMCRKGQTTDWAVYLDARPDLAQGSGGLFVCTEFEPEEDVQALL